MFHFPNVDAPSGFSSEMDQTFFTLCRSLAGDGIEQPQAIN